MSEGKNLGVSKTMFVAGFIIAILVSSLISVMAATLIKGPKGDKGDTGSQGPQGEKGEQGPPGSATNFARWSLTWYTITGDRKWGAAIGTSTWGAVFDHNFGTTAVFGAYNDYIGFQATMTINMQRDGPVRFMTGSDDGSRLYLDGELWIDNWGPHSYVELDSTTGLSKGFHTLTLWYYDISGNARVSFNCDPDILMWNP